MKFVSIDEEKMKNIIEMIGRFIDDVDDDSATEDALNALKILREEYDKQIVNYKELPEKGWWK